jgi:hypothetical protein
VGPDDCGVLGQGGWGGWGFGAVVVRRAVSWIRLLPGSLW